MTNNDNILDDKPIIFIRFDDDKILIRNVNYKMIKHICNLYSIPIHINAKNKIAYVDTTYTTEFLNALTRSNRHVFII